MMIYLGSITYANNKDNDKIKLTNEIHFCDYPSRQVYPPKRKFTYF